jgi:hypothetical protein
MATPQANETVGDGVIVEYSSDDVTYTPFAEVLELEGNKITPPEIKANNIADAAVTSQPGQKIDYGEVPLQIKFKKAIAAILMTAVNSGTIQFYRITVIDGAATHRSIAKFEAWIKELDLFGAIKEGEMLITKITFRITGASTFTAGT